MKWALITGASAGLGEEFAWQLAAEPLNLVLVARREDRLEDLAARLRSVAGVQVEVLAADLVTKAGQYAVVRRLQDKSRPVAVLVNNAGFGLGQSFVDGDWKREEAALEVMGGALARLCYEGARAMRSRVSRFEEGYSLFGVKLPWRRVVLRGGGVIINVSSATAYTAMGSYASIKTWVRFFSESLATELAGSGVWVTAVCPGLMHTEFHQVAQMDAEAWPRIGFVSKEAVVRQSIEAARRHQVLVTPTWRYRFLMGLARLAPRWVMRRFFGAAMFSRAI